MKLLKLFIISFMTLFISGCFDIKNVKPWEKATLSKDSMTQGGGELSFEKFQNHIYFSKESSKGGAGVSGGGCGCN